MESQSLLTLAGECAAGFCTQTRVSDAKHVILANHHAQNLPPLQRCCLCRVAQEAVGAGAMGVVSKIRLLPAQSPSGAVQAFLNAILPDNGSGAIQKKMLKGKPTSELVSIIIIISDQHAGDRLVACFYPFRRSARVRAPTQLALVVCAAFPRAEQRDLSRV